MKRKEAHICITNLTKIASNVSGTVELNNAVTGESYDIDLLALTSGIIAGMNAAMQILEMPYTATNGERKGQEKINNIITDASKIYAGAFLNDRYSHGNE